MWADESTTHVFKCVGCQLTSRFLRASLTVFRQLRLVVKSSMVKILKTWVKPSRFFNLITMLRKVALLNFNSLESTSLICQGIVNSNIIRLINGLIMLPNLETFGSAWMYYCMSRFNNSFQPVLYTQS